MQPELAVWIEKFVWKWIFSSRPNEIILGRDTTANTAENVYVLWNVILKFFHCANLQNDPIFGMKKRIIFLENMQPELAVWIENFVWKWTFSSRCSSVFSETKFSIAHGGSLQKNLSSIATAHQLHTANEVYLTRLGQHKYGATHYQ